MENTVSKENGVLEASQKEKPSLAVELVREQGSIVEIVNKLILEAYAERASDIHIDPRDKEVRIRLRIDGVLHDRFVCAKNMHNEVISRIKVLTGLRTDEHQAAQDGRFHIATPEGGKIDIRVSITPTYFGENAVLRLLNDGSMKYTLASLGFSDSDCKEITRAVRKPYGMILATGPTGSGKTTTLYTLIQMVSTPEVSIVTIEDPIECALEGITQIQANHRSGLTFASGLRSMLRQDPDIIMVGEIRDSETAGIAVNTALTGHLLLSTLHTNDAATTLPRLLDMGIDPYLVASTANIAIGQRLVRRVCADCKESYRPTDAERENIRRHLGRDLAKGAIFHRAVGCEKCGGTGYRGRLVISEVLIVDRKIQEAILRKESSGTIRELAIENGMTPMLEDGMQKVERGMTTITEVLRTLND